jgi:hypothetical protein
VLRALNDLLSSDLMRVSDAGCISTKAVLTVVSVLHVTAIDVDGSEAGFRIILSGNLEGRLTCPNNRFEKLTQPISRMADNKFDKLNIFFKAVCNLIV